MSGLNNPRVRLSVLLATACFDNIQDTRFITAYCRNYDFVVHFDSCSSKNIIGQSVIDKKQINNIESDNTSFGWVSNAHSLISFHKVYLKLDFGKDLTVQDYFHILPNTNLILIGIETMAKYAIVLDTKSKQVSQSHNLEESSQISNDLDKNFLNYTSLHEYNEHSQIKLPRAIGVFESFFSDFPSVPLSDREAFLKEISKPTEAYLNECVDLDPDVACLLRRYSKIMDPNQTILKGIPGFEMPITLKPGAIPVFAKPRVIALPLRSQYNVLLMRLRWLNVIGISIDSIMSCPVHVVRSNGSKRLRLVWDLRMVNLLVVKFEYPIPRPESLLQAIGGSKYFCMVDLTNAYFQMKVSAFATTILTFDDPCNGIRYKMNRGCPGMVNSGSYFVCLLNKLLNHKWVFSYIDDIICIADSKPQMLQRLEIVFKTFHDYNILISPKKCKFLVQKIVFLGQEITPTKITPLLSRVKAIEKITKPITLKHLQSYLGSFGYIRNHIPNIAEVLDPLYKLVGSMISSKKRTITWTSALEDSFEQSKKALHSAVSLNFWRPELQTCVFTDSSSSHLGGILTQCTHGNYHSDNFSPLGFYSRSFPSHYLDLPIWKKELLAILYTLIHFSYYISFDSFILFTDNTTCYNMLQPNANTPSPKIYRIICKILEFQPTVKLIGTRMNFLSDFLSRNRAFDSSDFVKHDELIMFTDSMQADTNDLLFLSSSNKFYYKLAKSQKSDVILQKYLTSPELTSLNIVSKQLDDSSKLYGAISESFVFRPYITSDLIQEFISIIHSEGHFGQKKTLAACKEKGVFPNMSKSVKDFVNKCVICQKSKIYRYNITKLENFKAINKIASTFHTDVFHLPLNPQGYNKVLLLVDRASRHISLLPCKTETSTEILFLMFHYCFSIIGFPRILISDNASCYTSNLFKTTMKAWGIIHRFVSPSLHFSNGQAERFCSILKTGLRTISGLSGDWLFPLANLKLLLNNSINTDFQISPNEILFGRNLPMAGHLWDVSNCNPFDRDEARKYLIQRSAVQPLPYRKYSSKASHDLGLDKYTHVLLVKHPKHNKIFLPKYTGPYRLLEYRHKNSIIERRGRKVKVSNMHLKGYNPDGLPFEKLLKSINDRPRLTTIEEEELSLSDSDDENVDELSDKITMSAATAQEATVTVPREVQNNETVILNDNIRRSTRDRRPTTRLLEEC